MLWMCFICIESSTTWSLWCAAGDPHSLRSATLCFFYFYSLGIFYCKDWSAVLRGCLSNLDVLYFSRAVAVFTAWWYCWQIVLGVWEQHSCCFFLSSLLPSHYYTDWPAITVHGVIHNSFYYLWRSRTEKFYDCSLLVAFCGCVVISLTCFSQTCCFLKCILTNKFWGATCWMQGVPQGLLVWIG